MNILKCTSLSHENDMQHKRKKTSIGSKKSAYFGEDVFHLRL